MSESSSGVNTSSSSFPKSHSSQYSELNDTHHRLSVEHTTDSGIVGTPLPSSRFRFTSWHQIEETDVRGDQLACPRVRERPAGDDHELRNGQIFSRNSRRKKRGNDKRLWEERLQENWENCMELNLSYQDLGDKYQLENFTRILRRLIRVERLQLVENALCDLSSIRLPRCQSLNLHRNHLKSLAQLPKIPAIEHLCVSENNISSLAELKLLEHTPLHTLTLRHNPCEFLEDYRSARVLLFAKTQSPRWHPKVARRFGASLFPRILWALHHSITLADLRQDVQPNGQKAPKAMILSTSNAQHAVSEMHCLYIIY